MDESKVENEMDELLQDVYATNEFMFFKSEIERRMASNKKPRKNSTLLVTINGQLIDEAACVLELMSSELTKELLDRIDDLAIVYIASLYDAESFQDLESRFCTEHFAVLDERFDRLNDEMYTGINIKLRPNIQKTIAIMNFNSPEQYAEFLVHEEINTLRKDLEVGIGEDEFSWLYLQDTEGFWEN
jgi:hypothetical protein